MFVLVDLQKKIKSSEPCSREDDIAKLENALDNDSLDDVNVDAEQNAIATELEEVRAALEQNGIEPDNLLSASIQNLTLTFCVTLYRPRSFKRKRTGGSG